MNRHRENPSTPDPVIVRYIGGWRVAVYETEHRGTVSVVCRNVADPDMVTHRLIGTEMVRDLDPQAHWDEMQAGHLAELESASS